jgi:hypothetical protein|nr:MAG TPA: LPP20 lipoprotein factor [Caudoviricetes sp.]
MKLTYPFAVVIAAIILVALTGCAGINPLSALTDKPEVTAQVGAENVKQTVGFTAKKDESTKQEMTVKDSTVGKVDSSSHKQVKASTIQANEIKAESITVNGGDTLGDLPMLAFVGLCLFVAGFLSGKVTKKKEA